MYLIAAFLLGIANFAMHKAVVESGHPFVEDTKLYFGRHFGRNGSYFLEFGILLGAMLFAYWCWGCMPPTPRSTPSPPGCCFRGASDNPVTMM
jgi:hypothetical protein